VTLVHVARVLSSLVSIWGKIIADGRIIGKRILEEGIVMLRIGLFGSGLDPVLGRH
jgi:hypothetical protein